MNNQQNKTDSSAVNTHPICRNSTNPEKCAEFAEKLEQVNSNLEIKSSLAFQLEADERSLA